MTDWRRVAEDFEEKAGVAQMWLDEARGLLADAACGYHTREAAADFLRRYDEERKKDR